ncbi:MAG: hypothetical protein H0T89_34510 [Deltaproteobacteria bacterium]|nr:hypothetical protein [Deltaproteobacteria bacterium]MDQ3297010.1 hypothetical protein [Myxococcota bacterium]
MIRIAAIVALAIAGIVASPARAEPQRTVAGSLQLDYLALPTEPRGSKLTLDGTTVELSLRMSVDFNPRASATVKACFACHGFEAAAAFVDMRVSDELAFRIGRFTPSFGSFPQRYDPANHRMSDKPLPYDMGRMVRMGDWNEGILPAPWVDNGIEVGGTVFFGDGRVDYAVYGVTGAKGQDEAADLDFRLSRTPETYYTDNNSEPSVGARVASAFDIDDHHSISVGLSAMGGHYDPAARLAYWIVGTDVVAKLPWLTLRAEYLQRRTQMALGADPESRFKYGPGANGRFDDTFVKHGFYVESELPIGRVDLLGRWDGLIRHGNVLAGSVLTDRAAVFRWTAGIAIRVTGEIRIKSSVEYYRFRDLPDELAIHTGLATPF